MIEVELRDLKNVLDDVVVEDDADFDLQQIQPEGKVFKSMASTHKSFLQRSCKQ